MPTASHAFHVTSSGVGFMDTNKKSQALALQKQEHELEFLLVHASLANSTPQQLHYEGCLVLEGTRKESQIQP